MRILKWIGIVAGVLIALLAGILGYIIVAYDRYGLYPSGGALSERQAMFDVVHYDIHLAVDASRQRVDGYVIVRLKPLAGTMNEVELDLIDNFDVSSVTLDSKPLAFTHDGDKLLIELPKAPPAGDVLALRVDYGGRPPEALLAPWVGGFTWSRDTNGHEWVGLSCQAEGAKIWVPCKDHPSDEPDSAAIHLTVPGGYVAVSNGVLRDVTHADGKDTYHWATRYPINNYSLTVNVGRYDLVEQPYITERGDSMAVKFWVLPADKARADTLVEMAIEMLTTYRKFYGEYPWTLEKFGLVQTDYLGMEHQTLNSYGNEFQYRIFHGVTFDELMLHEMGHEWWGNKVTVRDWADFWIQEGICTYGEALYILDKAGEDAYHSYMQTKRRMVRNRRPIVRGHDLREGQAYHGDIYYKGACFMHTLRFVLGDSIFFPSLKEFANNPKYVSPNEVTTKDWLELVNRNSGRDLTGLFSLYLYTVDLPEVLVDSAGRDAFDVSLRNIDFPLPMELATDKDTTRVTLGKQPIRMTSATRPVIDPRDWYLKRVVNSPAAP